MDTDMYDRVTMLNTLTPEELDLLIGLYDKSMALSKVTDVHPTWTRLREKLERMRLAQ